MSAKPTRSRYSEEIKEVWRAWLGTQPEKSRDRFKLTDQRRSKIRARLSRDGCSLQDLLDAVRGWPLDDWEGRRAANAIEILLRDRGQVEKFSKLYRERNGGLPEGWSVL